LAQILLIVSSCSCSDRTRTGKTALACLGGIGYKEFT
jgi:hypothetical protein